MGSLCCSCCFPAHDKTASAVDGGAVDPIGLSTDSSSSSEAATAVHRHHPIVEELRGSGSSANDFFSSTSSEEYSVEDMDYYLEYEPLVWPAPPSTLTAIDKRRVSYEERIRACAGLTERKKLIDEYESLKESKYATEYEAEAPRVLHEARQGGRNATETRRAYWQAIHLHHSQEKKLALKLEYNRVYRQLMKNQ